jgi:hypothetical protein
MTNKEQIETLYEACQKLSEDFELAKLEANDYINKLLIEAGIEELVSKKQEEIEAKRQETQEIVNMISEKIRELEFEETTRDETPK